MDTQVPIELDPLAKPIILKVLIPQFNVTKLIKFVLNQTVEDAIHQIRDVLPSNASDSTEVQFDFGLFLPQTIEKPIVTSPRRRSILLSSLTLKTSFTNIKAELGKSNQQLSPSASISNPEEINEGIWLNPKETLACYHLEDRKSRLVYKRREPSSTILSEGEDINPIITSPRRGSLKNALPKFLENRVSQEELMRRKILHQECHTGTPLPLSLETVMTVFAYIETSAIEAEGIYRVSGLQEEVRALEKTFGTKGFSLHHVKNPHTVCSAIKLYFREMTPPLIPFELYDQFISLPEILEEQQQIDAMKNAISSLPLLNRWIFEALIRHLYIVSKHSVANKMIPSNIGVVIGPIIMRSKVQMDSITLITENARKCQFIVDCLKYTDKIFEDGGFGGNNWTYFHDSTISHATMSLADDPKEKKHRRRFTMR